MNIIVTGSVGTGKTRFARYLSKKLNLKYIDVNKFVKDKNLSIGFDKIRDCEVVDEEILAMELSTIHDSVVDSHMSQVMDPAKVKICYVMKCELSQLKERLIARKYSRAKVKENIQAEIFDVCLEEAKERGHKVMVVDTSN